MPEDHNYKYLSNKIVNWYNKNARKLPWRDTTDPYIIWISEIVLQQTTVNQGLEYFNRFILAFPNVIALAQATEDQVLKLWEGLGYYSRARNLHFTAKHIYNNLDGVFPNTYNDLLVLKGVGPYTASAIASFAYNLPHVVVDGNVIRLISRLWGIEEAVDIKTTLNKIGTIGSQLISYQEPAIFNQAIMEIGALCCTYRNPQCNQCPVSKSCIARKKGLISSIPYKSKKIVKKKRYFYYYHIVDKNNNTYIQKRSEEDIWKGLYQFPLQEVSGYNIEPNLSFLSIEDVKFETFKSKIFKQTLTHQYIHAQFLILKIPYSIKEKDDLPYIICGNDDLNTFAWPKVIDLYFKDLSITLF